MKMIDLRSDTVTRPSQAMRDAMANAVVGDDVFGDDPTVIQLEEFAAEMLGTESAIFASSGTQSNLMALLSHCERGEEYIVGQDAHTYKYEAGGAAVLGSIQPQPIEFEADGSLDLDKVKAYIKPDDFHYAKTKLLCLENTQGGKVLSMDYIQRAATLARSNGLAFHLDGARIFNAAVKLQIPVSEIAQHFDSISVCLSKGLGAPVGSVLCGTTELIGKARRWRKMLGGGMRQVGILAAAGIYALQNNVDRLADDHANASTLAKSLSTIDGLDVNPDAVETNMMFIEMSDDSVQALTDYLKDNGILIDAYHMLRLALHLDISSGDIPRIADSFTDFFNNR